MRSRPALAIAAALIPAALLTGATASATDSPTPSASAAGESPTQSVSPSPSASAPASESPSATASPSSSTSSSPSSPPDSASPSPTASRRCSSEPGDQFLSATVSGETNFFIPGDGWHGLTITLENVSDTALRDITVEVQKFAFEEAPDFPPERQEYVNIQRWDKQSRTWAEIPWAESQIDGRLPPVDIAPRTTVTLQLRMSVEADIPYGRWPEMETEVIGNGYITLNAFGPDGEGVCGHVKWWSYNIGRPVTATGDGGGSEPPSSSEPTLQTGGTGPADATTAPTGDLADTGSSAALPVIGLMGGAAVALGAGAVYAVRRRRAGTDAA